MRVFAREIDFEQLLEMQEKLTLLLKNVVKMLNVKRLNEQSWTETSGTASVNRRRGFLTGRLLGITEDAPKTRKKTLPKARPSINLKKMVKLNTGLVVGVTKTDCWSTGRRSLSWWVYHQKDASSSAGDEQ